MWVLPKAEFIALLTAVLPGTQSWIARCLSPWERLPFPLLNLPRFMWEPAKPILRLTASSAWVCIGLIMQIPIPCWLAPSITTRLGTMYLPEMRSRESSFILLTQTRSLSQPPPASPDATGDFYSQPCPHVAFFALRMLPAQPHRSPSPS